MGQFQKGEHTVIVKAGDKAENKSEKSIKFIIDPDPPQISLSKSGPKEGPVTVAYSVNDDSLSTVTFILDGNSQTIPVSDGQKTVSNSTSVSAPGDHTATVKATDKAGNNNEKTITFTIDKEADNPDENDDPSGEDDIIINPDPNAPVGILQNGYYNSVASLLSALKEKYVFIDTFFSSEIVEQYPIMIIPSGGLYGLENSPTFKEALALYVNRGGTVIVFSQQHGYEYGALPGQPAAYGWNEDQSCYYKSTIINDYHQVLSGQDSIECDAYVDGYFTSWPENATILLKRSKNGMPAALVYNYGNGRVIATSLYEDWGYGHGQSTVDGKNFVRDAVVWAKKPQNLPEFKPNSSFQSEIVITNNTLFDAAQIKIKVTDPAKGVIKEETISQTVFSRESIQLGIGPLTLSSNLGIWCVSYELLDETCEIIKEETIGELFAVSKHLTSVPQEGVYFDIISNGEKFPYGSEAVFIINIFNNTNQDKQVTCWYSFPHHYWELRQDIYGSPGTTSPGNRSNLHTTVDVPAHSENSFVYSIPVGARLDRLWADFYDENGTYLGGSSRGFYGFPCSASLELKTERDIYNIGETIDVQLSLQNRKSETYLTQVQLIATDPSNNIIYREEFEVELSPSGVFDKPISFSLPFGTPEGIGVIKATAFSNGTQIAAGATYFKVPEAQILINPVIPGVLKKGSNNLSFILTNTGFTMIDAGTFRVRLTDPNQMLCWESEVDFNGILLSEKKQLDFEMQVNEVVFGEYLLEYWVETGGRSFNSIQKLPCSIIIETSLAQSYLKIRENLSMDLRLVNNGRFALEDFDIKVNVPDAEFNTEQIVNLNPNQSQSLTMNIPIPDTLEAGQHEVIISGIAGSTVTKTTQFTIIPSKLVCTVDSESIQTGDSINVGIKNGGGVDTTAEICLKLYDRHGLKL